MSTCDRAERNGRLLAGSNARGGAVIRRLLAAGVMAVTVAAGPGCDGTLREPSEGLGSNRNWAGRYLRARLTPRQFPRLGEYSSRNPDVIRQHIDWAHQAQIGFFAIPWRGPASWGHVTLRDYLLTESRFAEVDFCIIYETPMILEGNPEAAVINLTLAARDTMLTHLLGLRRDFFGQGNYLYHDERPVVFIRHSRRIAGTTARQDILAVRQAYRDSTGGEDLYLIGDEAYLGPEALPNGSRLSAFDAFTGLDLATFGGHDGYPAGTGYLNDVGAMWQTWLNTVAALDVPIPVVPMVWPGYNDQASSGLSRPVIAREMSLSSIPSGGTYTQMWMIAYALEGAGTGLALLHSFNDWQRDTQIEPVAFNGNSGGTVLPTTYTTGLRYYPYQDFFLERTAEARGNVMLGALYEVWYENSPAEVTAF